VQENSIKQRVNVIYHHYIASINPFVNQENKITKTKIYREAYHFFDNKHRIKIKKRNTELVFLF
jgi:hypothetical protein